MSSLYPQPSAGTQIKKKETRIEQRNTDRSFHGFIFFDIIELMDLDLDLVGFASAVALPFLVVSVLTISSQTRRQTVFH